MYLSRIEPKRSTRANSKDGKTTVFANSTNRASSTNRATSINRATYAVSTSASSLRRSKSSNSLRQTVSC